MSRDRKRELQAEMLRLLKQSRDALRVASELADEGDLSLGRVRWREMCRVQMGSVTMLAVDLVDLDREERPEAYDRGEGLNPFEELELATVEHEKSPGVFSRVLRIFRPERRSA